MKKTTTLDISNVLQPTTHSRVIFPTMQLYLEQTRLHVYTQILDGDNIKSADVELALSSLFGDGTAERQWDARRGLTHVFFIKELVQGVPPDAWKDIKL